MKRLRLGWGFLLVVFVIVCIIAAFEAVPAKADSSELFDVEITVQCDQTTARKMFTLINEFRTGDEAWEWNEDNTSKAYYEELEALEYGAELERVAMQRAAELALSYQHTRPNNTYFNTFYSEYGIVIRSGGENVAAGFTDYVELHEAFLETDNPYEGQGHRRNMLRKPYNAVGIGHVICDGMHYWAEEFAQKTVVAPKECFDGECDVTVHVDSSMVLDVAIDF